MSGPWQDPIVTTRYFEVFPDDSPVTEGHLLFVPRVADWKHISECWQAAYRWGYEWVERGYCDAFNLGQDVGVAAGQTVEWPHVHLIPRRTGDAENPPAGVRGVVPGHAVR